MRKTIVPIFILICMALSGCEKFFPAGSEIEDYDTIQVMGIDVDKDDPSQIEVTIVGKDEKSSGTDSASTMTIKTYSAFGATAFEAQRMLRAKENKITFLGYVDYLLIGEKAAEEDFIKYFDYFVRDHETRLSPKVFVIRDSTVKEFIEKTSSGDMFIAERLDNIISGADLMANTAETRVIQVAGMLDSKYEPTIIPALKCEEQKGFNMTGEMPPKAIVTDGFAVIEDNKLAGFIEPECAAGYNFLMDKVDSYPVSVKDKTGKYVGLEVVKSDTKIEVHFSEDKLEGVTYKTFIISSLPEQQSREKITTREGINFICSAQSEKVKHSMEAVIKTSKDLKTDCIGLGDRIRIQHPYKWEKIKDKWKDIYPGLKIDVSVDSEIARSYDIVLPNGYQGKE